MDKITMRRSINDTLMAIDLHSPQATDLLMGTSAHESAGWKFTRQLGGGPALGYFQMEPATHTDCWKNYLAYNKPLADKILRVSGLMSPPTASELVTNLKYAICMARVKYLRDSQPIPLNLQGQAEMWKRVYNTPLGKGTVQEYINHYKMYVA